MAIPSKAVKGDESPLKLAGASTGAFFERDEASLVAL